MNTETVLDRSTVIDINDQLADLVEHARAITISNNLPHEVRAFATNFLALHDQMLTGDTTPAAWA